MKLRTAIHAADKVLIQASHCGTPIRFRVAKAEVYRVVVEDYLDTDLSEKYIWSESEGLFPFWVGNNLVLSFT